ncbi:hypothetical protein [Campylobacter sp. RM12651]|uniref:hypothetical protein n=1 Tax=Campylobacter sp. RM12651 TaxID=1660079 RepID=UPI001EFB7EEE|nr:hypothetical protein [Campylobacter sp. RM12651]ULO04547.1 hypothetical protein AVBRAN_a0065 [Campylobacter sp. RM12651]
MTIYDAVVMFSTFVIAFVSTFVILIAFLQEDAEATHISYMLKQEQINELMLFFNISKEDAVFILNNHLLYKDYQKEIINFLIKKQKKS